jgi:hypothetical protein
MLFLARNELSPAEREEREVERLIGRKPPPSRKYTDRRGPKHDNRRHRMETDDPDLEGGTAETDVDISLRSREASLIWIARRIAEKSPETLRSPGISESEPPTVPVSESETPTKEIPTEKVPSTPKRRPPRKKVEEGAVARPELITKLINNANGFKETLSEISPALGNAFEKFSRHYIIGHPEGKGDVEIKDLTNKVAKMEANFKAKAKDISEKLAKAGREDALKLIADTWPTKANDFAGRGAVISGIDKAIDKAGIPAAFATPFKRKGINDAIRDKKLIKNIINSVSGKNLKGLDEETIFRFVQLISAYQFLLPNPDQVSVGDLSRNMDDLEEIIEDQAYSLVELGMIMDTWRSVMSGFKSPPKGEEWRPGQNFTKVFNSVDQLFDIEGKGRELVEPSMFIDELREFTKEKYGEFPEEIEDYFSKFKFKSSKSAATSNKIFHIKAMASRVAAYHGVDDRRGNPTETIGTPWKSYDKRYFTEDNYKSILKVAQQYLQEDWLKYCWKSGSEEAPLRAALDLAIHMADDNLYQSKIDAETYEMLLNRLAKWGHDSFSETILPFKKSKRSAAMGKNIQSVLRIASEVRKTDPKKAVEIVASLRSLVATPNESSEEHVAPDIPWRPSGMLPATQEERAQGKSGTPVDMPDDAQRAAIIAELDKLDKELQARDDLPAFLQTLKDLWGKLTGKTAGRIAGEAEINRMIEEALQQAEEGQITEEAWDAIPEGDSRKLKEWIKVEQFDDETVEGLMELLENFVSEITEGKTASVSISTLIKIAYNHPDTRSTLLPVIIAAKKKKDKKKSKKKDKKGEGKGHGGPPFEGASPPFGKGGPPDGTGPEGEGPGTGHGKGPCKGKGKGKGKGKRKKAAICREDMDW